MIVLESMRRLLVAACLFSAVYLVLMPGPELVVAGIENFARSQAENPYFAPAGESLEDFVRRRTAGRALYATDGDWPAFAESLAQGRPSAALQRIDQAGTARWVFHRDALPALPGAGGQGLSYVRAGDAGPWVRLEFTPASGIHGLQARWAHPWRWTGLALLPLAVLLYRFIPRQAPQPDRLSYARLPAVVIPDWLGLAGGALFFALYLLIHHENLPGQSVPATQDGWWLLLLVFAVMVAGFLLLVVTAWRYATLYLRLTPHGLEVHRWRGTRCYPWADMQDCVPYRSTRGGRIGALLALLAPGPGGLGQGLLLGGNEEWGVEIRMQDGERIRVMGNAFPGFDRVVTDLVANAVPGSGTLGRPVD
jgi:hypothetical protein